MARAPILQKRLLLLAALPALAFAGPAGAAPERLSSVHLDVPTRAVQGNYVSASVNVSPRGARCSLSVQYNIGTKQQGLGTRVARGGRANFVMPDNRLIGSTTTTWAPSPPAASTRSEAI